MQIFRVQAHDLLERIKVLEQGRGGSAGHGRQEPAATLGSGSVD